MSKEKKTDPSSFRETIIESNISEKVTEWQKIYGANKNLYRCFASLVDGLKPVERRALYGLYLDKRYHGKMLKLSKASTNAVSFHPHGDASISDVIIGMSQDWVNNVPLIHTDGNNGSIKGDAPAAPRYLDVCMSDFAYDCYFEDYENSNVDTRLAYTGEEEEPDYLPAKYPVCIINGGFASIGYAYSSNVPPFNFKEVCETTIALMKDPDAKVLIYPDLPSGCDLIMTKKEAKDIFENGIGKIQMQSSYDIDYINNIITFKSIPMQTTTGQIVDNITALRLKGKMDDSHNKDMIKDVQDRTTDNNGVLLEIHLQANVNPEEALEKLFKSKTTLRKTNPMQITLIKDFRSDEYSVRRVLLEWINFRRDVKRSSYNNEFAKLLDKQHILKAKIMMQEGHKSDEITLLSKSSNDMNEFVDKVMKKYDITSLQAKAVSDIRTSDYLKDSKAKFKEEYDKITERLNHIQDILESESKIDKEIIKELEEGIRKYGVPRKSSIISGEKKIEDKDVVVGISSDGYIKKIDLADAKGNMGPISKDPKNEKSMVISVRENDSILLFDREGNVHLLAVRKLPTIKVKNNGLLIDKYIKGLDGKDIISASIAPKSSQMGDKIEYMCVTRNGFAKRVSATSLLKAIGTSGDATVITLNEGDELVVAGALNVESKELIMFTNFGDGVRLSPLDIPLQQPTSKGSRMVTIRPREHIIGSTSILPTDKYLVVVTLKGKIKLTELKYFPVMSKKDEPMVITNIFDNDEVFAVKSVSDDNEIVVYKKKGDKETLKISEIPLKSRIAEAEKLIKLNKSDIVVSVVIK